MVSNVAQHAFSADEEGEMMISLDLNSSDEIELIIADNGVSASGDLDFYGNESMGFQIVRNIVKYQLKGEVKFESVSGIKCKICFKNNVYEERI